MPTYCPNCGMIDVYPEDDSVWVYDHCLAASAASRSQYSVLPEEKSVSYELDSSNTRMYTQQKLFKG